jgi:hypothetical protein
VVTDGSTKRTICDEVRHPGAGGSFLPHSIAGTETAVPAALHGLFRGKLDSKQPIMMH